MPNPFEIDIEENPFEIDDIPPKGFRTIAKRSSTQNDIEKVIKGEFKEPPPQEFIMDEKDTEEMQEEQRKQREQANIYYTIKNAKAIDEVETRLKGLDEKIKSQKDLVLSDFSYEKRPISMNWEENLRNSLDENRFLSRKISENNLFQQKNDKVSEYEKLLNEQKFYKLSESILQDQRKYIETKDEKFLKSLGSKVTDTDFLTLGLKSLFESVNIADIAVKYNKEGENKLTEPEKMALSVYGMFNDTKSQTTSSLGYDVASSIAESIPFMIAFATGTPLTKIAEKGTEKIINKWLKKGIEYSIKAGIITMTTGSPQTIKSIEKRRIGDILTDEEGKIKIENQQLGAEGIYKGIASNYTENLSEYLGNISKPISKAATPYLKKIGLNRILDVVPNKPKLLKNIEEAVQFQGLFPEYFIEELPQPAMEAVATWEEEPLNAYTKEEQLRTFLSIAGTRGIFFMIGTPGYVKNKRTEYVQKKEKAANDILTKNRVEIDKIINSGESFDKIGNNLNDYIQIRIDEGLDRDGVNVIRDYVESKVILDAMNEVEGNMITEQKEDEKAPPVSEKDNFKFKDRDVHLGVYDTKTGQVVTALDYNTVQTEGKGKHQEYLQGFMKNKVESGEFGRFTVTSEGEIKGFQSEITPEIKKEIEKQIEKKESKPIEKRGYEDYTVPELEKQLETTQNDLSKLKSENPNEFRLGKPKPNSKVESQYNSLTKDINSIEGALKGKSEQQTNVTEKSKYNQLEGRLTEIDVSINQLKQDNPEQFKKDGKPRANSKILPVYKALIDTRTTTTDQMQGLQEEEFKTRARQEAEKSRIETEKVNKAFEERQQTLEKNIPEQELQEEKEFDEVNRIFNKVSNEETPTQEEIDYVNEKAYLPKGYKFGKTGLEKISVKQKMEKPSYATQERKITESNQQQYKQAEARGIPSETVSSYSYEQGGEIEEQGKEKPLKTDNFKSAVTKGLDKGIDWLDSLNDELDKFSQQNLASVALPIPVVKLAINTTKTALKAGKVISEAIDAAINAVRNSEWYKNLGKTDKEIAERKIKEIFTGKRNIIDIVNDFKNEGKLSGIKKALVPEEIIEDTDVDKRTVKEMLETGKGLIETEEIDGTFLVQDIIENPRALQPYEVSALVYYKTQLDNKIDSTFDMMEEAKDTDELTEYRLLKDQYNSLNKLLDNYHEMSVITAYEQSLAFSLRKMLLDNEYNLQTQVKKYKAANNGEIPTHIEEKFKKIDEELQQAKKKIRELEDKRQQVEKNKIINDIKASIKRKGISERKRGKELIKEGVNDLNRFFASYAVGEESASISDFVKAASKIGKGLIDEGLATIENVIDKIEEYLGKNKGRINIYDYEKDIYDNIKSIEEPVIIDGNLEIPPDIIRDYVAGGIDDIEDLVKAIKEDFNLEANERDIRDAITNYGKIINLSQDEIEKKIREMKRIGKIISGIEDVKNELKRPKRSGLQRDKLTDKERRLQQELREVMKELPQTEEENKKQWKSALDAIKSRLKNQIADLQNQIETGEKVEKKKGVEYDEEAEMLREQRDVLKEIIKQIEGKKKLSDEQKIKLALNSINKWIKEYERRIENKDFSPLTNRAEPVKADILTKAKEKLNSLKDTYQKMKDAEGITEKQRLDRVKKNLQRSIDLYTEKLKNKDFSPKKKREQPELDREAEMLEVQKNIIKGKYDIEIEKIRLKNRPFSQRFKEGFMDVWNLPKSMLASFDLSAPFRQGLIFTLSKPKLAAKAFGEMFRQMASEKKYTEWLEHLRITPEYTLMKRSGLYIAETSTKLAAKEEQFMTNLAHKIPVLKIPIKASERAYTSYLNKLRVDVFNQLTQQLLDNGYTWNKNKELFKSVAKYVNNATGRGSLGVLEKSAVVLNNAFFSPRLIASRLNFINPVFYFRMPKQLQLEIWKNNLLTLSAGLTIIKLALMAGADGEDDPTSANFGKIRIGNLTLDIWAGFQQPIVLLSRIMLGKRKSISTGLIHRYSDTTYGDETIAKTIGRFFRSKFSPTSALIYDILNDRKDMMGNELKIDETTFDKLAPLYIQDLVEIYAQEGKESIFIAMLPALFGVGVQYIEPSDMDKTIQPIINKYKNKGYIYSDYSDRLDMKDELEEKMFPDKYDLSEKEKREVTKYKKRMDILALSQEQNKYAQDLLGIIAGSNEDKLNKIRDYYKKNGIKETVYLIEYMRDFGLVSKDFNNMLYDFEDEMIEK